MEKIKLKNGLRALFRLEKSLRGIPLSAYAAEASFFILLSVFPLAMAMGGLLRRFPYPPEVLINPLRWLLPAGVSELLLTAWEEALESSPGLISLSIFSALFASSQGVFALTRGLNAVLGLQEDRPWLLRRLTAVGQTVLLTGGLLLVSVGMLFGSRWLQTDQTFLRILRFILGVGAGFVLLWLTTATLYGALPARKGRLWAQKKGAAVTAAGWIIYSAGFAFYADRLADYSRIYGSLSSAAVCLLWLYACMYLLFIGAKINSLAGDANNQ